tara:strand:- start:6798 stop:7952 length:1155 start_codon:yes stop_codon:yes gene_type:complete
MKCLEIKYFGTFLKKNVIENKLSELKKLLEVFDYYLIIAGTDTSQIKGISAAGMDASSRKLTALADAEFLLFGPIPNYKYQLPKLNAGVTPALISNVCAKIIQANLIVIPIGITKEPYFKFLRVEKGQSKPANCLSTGKAMLKKRVINLYEKGLSIGLSSNKPIFISESVPGGTTTAQAIMEAFSLNVSDLAGSSLIDPPRKLKKEVILKGILKANLDKGFDSIDVIAALGDPFQAFAMGLIIGARKNKNMVVLAGGSQMVAVLLLALEYIEIINKQNFVEDIIIATTGWLVRDNSLRQLVDLVATKHRVKIYAFASCLNFSKSEFKQLSDYEKGYVKEGVGAGGFSMFANLKGISYEEIVSSCEYALRQMREVGQISFNSSNL